MDLIYSLAVPRYLLDSEPGARWFDAATNLTGKVHLAINPVCVMDAHWHRPIILQVPYYGGVYHPEYAHLGSAARALALSLVI